MTTLYKTPFYRQDEPHVAIAVELNETHVNKERTEMRLVFNTTVTVDVSANDDELRETLMKLVTQAAQTVYGPVAMLAKSRPSIKITETSRDGVRDIDMFDGTVVGGVDFD
jgi:hypothetical protein